MKSNKLIALVTGSSRGIGEEIATKLVKDGYKVITTGTKEDGYIKGTDYRRVDFLNNNCRESFLKSLESEEINILINNAGINKIGRFTDIQLQDFDSILEVNLRSPFLIMQAVIPKMIKRQWGRIVNISSIFGSISKEHRASYSASKFGLNGLTLAASAELSSQNILVNSVSPGFVDTDLTRGILGEDGISQLIGNIPIGRLGQPAEIAELVSWLVSSKNTYISGQNIIIDGGFINV
jgi:3-oxoacyl-[acyl-carrier protein] reductase